MKLKTKKIIAREFLIVAGCLLVFVLAFLSTLTYNLVIESKIDSYENSIQSITSDMDESIRSILLKEEKQKWFCDASDLKFDYGNRTTTDEVWERWSQLQKADSIRYLWYYEWDDGVKEIFSIIGFKSFQDFNTYIEEYSFTAEEKIQKSIADSINHHLVKAKDQLKIQKDRLLDFERIIAISFICFFMAVIIAFPLRYFFNSLKWSINTLKQK